MGVISHSPALWRYLAPDMQDLLLDGEFLAQDSTEHRVNELTDYSYIVFPFAKLFEGFLKKVFLDANIISEREYSSDHFRIGKTLSPNLSRLLGVRSAYTQISHRYNREFAARLWHMWKEGRNLVFHYFPHNYRKLSRDQAIELAQTLVNTMTETIEIFGVVYPLHDTKPVE